MILAPVCCELKVWLNVTIMYIPVKEKFYFKSHAGDETSISRSLSPELNY
jgi:hypothetical protein